MTDERTIAAPEVTVGSKWFVWGKHQEVIERVEPGEAEWFNGKVIYYPLVRLCRLDSKGKRLKPDRTLVAAWRVAKFGVPSEAYS